MLNAGDVAIVIVSFTVNVMNPKTVLELLSLGARSAACACAPRNALCSVGTDEGWDVESDAVMVPPPPVVATGTRIEPPIPVLLVRVTLSGLVLDTTTDPLELEPDDGLGAGVPGVVFPPPPPPPPPHATSSESAMENAASLRIIRSIPHGRVAGVTARGIVVQGVGGPASGG
jgi:hypothetical protein